VPCVANPPRRAPTGNASDDRIAGPRAPPAISFQAGIYADHAPSLHRSAESVAKGDRHCSHERRIRRSVRGGNPSAVVSWAFRTG